MAVTRPKDAASLVIYRQAGRALEVLMGCRHGKARFKPGVYVFPGGMLERSDFTVKPASDLSKSTTRRIAVGGSHQRARALALAAVRETYEEAGLAIASKGTMAESSDPTWSFFRTQGLAPNLQPLQYLGRAITPSHQPMRFHARFFSVSAEFTDGHVRENGELDDLGWVPVGKHHDLPMMNVTHMMLDTLQQHLSGETKKAPFLYFIHGKKIVKWQ